METEFSVTVRNIIDDNLKLFINDNDLSFIFPMEEFKPFDPKGEFKVVGSRLILTISGKDLIGVRFDIFCYDEEWQKHYDEICELLNVF